jgi:imidazoleglycerol phosphate synthase glutamine amidotransferase subunit HisH
MLTVLVDYDSGNLHSAEKAFQRMAARWAAVTSSSPRAPRTWRAPTGSCCPATGPFRPAGRRWGLMAGLFEAIEEAVIHPARPFLGICVGMQMLADRGHEYQLTEGFGWIPGEVVKITPADPALKVPHMGWNDLVIDQPHPVLDGHGTPAITPISCIPTSSASPIRRIGWPIATMAGRSPPSSGATISSAPSSTPRKPGRGPAADRQLPALGAVTLSQDLAEITAEMAARTDRGRVADYIPELAAIDPNQFGISVCLADGANCQLGTADPRSRSSPSPRSLALPSRLAAWAGLAFNSVLQLESEGGIPRNPFVNAGAIVTTDAALGHRPPKEYLAELLGVSCAAAGDEDIHINKAVARSETESGHRNFALAHFMKPQGNLTNPPDLTLAPISTNAPSR